MNQALQEFDIKDRDELLAQIGLGERLAPLVARRLLPGGHDDKRRDHAADRRRHRRPAGYLCALLPSDPG